LLFSEACELFLPFLMAKTKVGPTWIDKAKIRLKKTLGMNIFLCDSCKWNWRSACHYPERPNAVWCPDYQKKGK